MQCLVPSSPPPSVQFQAVKLPIPPRLRPVIKYVIFFRKNCESAGTQDDFKKPIRLPQGVENIRSTSNLFVKHCVNLRQCSSYRHLHGSVVVIGSAPVREILDFQGRLIDRPKVECLFILENCSIPEGIEHEEIRVVKVNSEVIRKLSGVPSVDSVQVIALLRIPSSFHALSIGLDHEDCRALFPSAHRILVLEGIQDPGNLGTLLRSAVAFRWDGVFFLPGCCDPFNEKAVRAGRGACFQIRIVSGTWAHLKTLEKALGMTMLAGHPATGREEGNPLITTLSKRFADSVVDIPLCLVLGSEGSGISAFAHEACRLVAIPMNGEFESLNVSVAGGIFMYMLQRNNVLHG